MDELTPYFLIFIGGITWSKIASLIIKGRRIDYWPKVLGEIFRSEVVDESGWHGSRYQFSYKAEVNYRFEINNISYQGSGIGLDESSHFLKLFAKNVIKKYPANSEVTIYYNPDDPKESYLKKDATSSTYLFLTTLGFVCFGIGLFELLFKK